jgi:hypothetical protein
MKELLDVFGSIVQLMERVGEAAARVESARKARLLRRPSTSSSGGVDPNVELIRACFQSEDNAKMWVRHFGLRRFTVSVTELTEKLLAETNHLADGEARGRVVLDLVLTVVDLNGDGQVDLVELAVALPAKSAALAVEQNLEKYLAAALQQDGYQNRKDVKVASGGLTAEAEQGGAVAHGRVGSGGPDCCERCGLIEAELVIAHRTADRLRAQLRDAHGMLKVPIENYTSGLKRQVEALLDENHNLRRVLEATKQELARCYNSTGATYGTSSARALLEGLPAGIFNAAYRMSPQKLGGGVCHSPRLDAPSSSSIAELESGRFRRAVSNSCQYPMKSLRTVPSVEFRKEIVVEPGVFSAADDFESIMMSYGLRGAQETGEGASFFSAVSALERGEGDDGIIISSNLPWMPDMQPSESSVAGQHRGPPLLPEGRSHQGSAGAQQQPLNGSMAASPDTPMTAGPARTKKEEEDWLIAPASAADRDSTTSQRDPRVRRVENFL